MGRLILMVLLAMIFAIYQIYRVSINPTFGACQSFFYHICSTPPFVWL